MATPGSNTPGSNKNNSSGRGFAGMDREQARKIQRKGGETVSKDRQHMADIGRRGGKR